MNRVIVSLIVLFLNASLSAQSNALKGTVSNNSGKPIAGANVSLAVQKQSATTDSKGAYSITVNVAIQTPGLKLSEANPISIVNNMVIVNVSNPVTVQIEIFDIRGNLLEQFTDKTSSAGTYRFDPMKRPFASGMMILKVKAGQIQATFRSIPSRSGNQLVATSTNAISSGNKLVKLAAVVDTLIVSATGYKTKSLPISSYTGQNDLSLDTINLAKFSFFLTSLKAIQELSKSENGFGGDLRFGKTGQGAGLLGADSICQCIAERSMKGSGVKQWRAFLSVSKGPNGQQVNAIDRVGNGPWYDRLGRTVALTKADLANQRPKNCDEDIVDDLPNEDGIPNHRPDPSKAQVDNHLTITGSDTKGNLYAANATCSDWTSTAASGSQPRAGLSWPRSMGGFPAPSTLEKSTFSMDQNNWISSWSLPGCEAGICLVEKGGPLPGETFIGAGGGYGGFYCFALNP